MWNQLHTTIHALVSQGIHQMDDCDGTDKQTLAYAFFNDMGYDVTELITDNALIDAMEATPSVAAGLLLFWQTIAPLDYDQLRKRYLVDDFEDQLARVCEDIFDEHDGSYWRDQELINSPAGCEPWLREYL